MKMGRRVLVTRLAGSRKSTFSRVFAAKTDLPVIHLDLHFWKPGWVSPQRCWSRGRLYWLAEGFGEACVVELIEALHAAVLELEDVDP